MNEKKCQIKEMFVRTFVIPFYYGSGTVINYGSGSDFLPSSGSGSGSTQQKATVLTVSVPEHWARLYQKLREMNNVGARDTA
jgi:hypothetical protein